MSEPADREELTCDDVEPLLPLIADGEIDESSDPAVFAHLARCMACQDDLARYDLLTLALASPRPAAATHIRLLPLPWTAAAAGVAAAIGSLAWLDGRAGEAAPPAGVGHADREVIRVETPLSGQGYYILLHRSGAAQMVDPRHTASLPAPSTDDRRARGQAQQGLQPVSSPWY